jgi:tRNA A-37 threonylcarbamoyl transferase component Bud32
MKNETNNLKDYVKVSKDGWTGTVHQAFRDVPLETLVDENATDDRRSSFVKVTSSDTAEVYRYEITVGDQKYPLYLKKYPHRSLLDAVKHLFRPSRAKRAFEAGIMLEQYGLHTPQIVAFLQKKDKGLCTEDILITREMDDATAIQHLLGQNTFDAEREKRSLIIQLGKTIGRMHAAGICHGDLRGGNVFASHTADGWRFILIDNERTVKYPVLPLWLRRKNLVQLNIHRSHISRTDRLRFLQAYCQTAGISPEQSKRLARIVSKMTSNRLKHRAKTRTGLSGDLEGTHWNFQKAQLGNQNGIFLAEFARADTAAEFLRQVDRLMETGEVLKNDVSTRVVRSEFNGFDVVIKRYNYQGLWHSLRHTVKGSRAMKCWRLGHVLTEASIPCAAPLGVIEELRSKIIRQSYIINAYVEGPLLYVPMNDPNCPPQEREAIVAKAERVLEQLGKNRLTHSDMKSANLIIAEGGPVLIDLDSMQQHRSKGFYFRNRFEKMIRTFHRRLDGKK